MRRVGRRLGGKLGLAFVVAGLVLVFLGWNGAASYDRVPSQFPYLISGGLGGLCLVVVGSALLVVDAVRRDRAALQASLDELREAVSSAAPVPGPAPGAGEGAVVAGSASYHRPGCRLLDGRGRLPVTTEDEARARGLAPCRVCAGKAGPRASTPDG